jgi:phytoene dehydrogenase-like protein
VSTVPRPGGSTAVVIGAGPNGLAAAIALAQAGVRVTVLEAKDTVGGGTRTAELTLPGFRHDVCSAVHPLAASSPFFASLPLEEHGLRWLQPEIPLAHPFDDGTAATLLRSLDDTAASLGRDAPSYARLMGSIVESWDRLSDAFLSPVLRLPRDPFLLARFGLSALRPATWLARQSFQGPRARALFTGIAAHANSSLDGPFTASFGLVLGAAAHVVGWPIAQGGSQSIADALVSYLRSLGGEIVTGRRVESLDDLPPCDAILFDLTPKQLLKMGGSRLSESYRRALGGYRYGPGVFKLDYALDGPIPWTAPDARRAGTVHLGGRMEEMVASEADVAHGREPLRPYVLLSQPSLFDDTRAPAGKHTCWAYCHVPNGSAFDMTERVEAQIERFAPGFKDLVLARHAMRSSDLQAYNENYVGGDIQGGAAAGLQLFLRPAWRLSPYTTSDPRLFICSSATPPGAGVHGMCGYNAAQAVLRRLQR